MKLTCNCCDGIYNSFDVHFTSVCDNKCKHCVDMRFSGMGVKRPDTTAIFNTILDNCEGLDDVLFLGGEPCLFLDDLIYLVNRLRNIHPRRIKLYVTTSVPKICYDEKEKFFELIEMLDGINLSVQHYDESTADEIRCTESKYNRQAFYASLPHKEKIRINLNIVKPFLYTRRDITACLYHYDNMGFNSIKLSEIQHGKEFYVSFADTFGIKMDSAYANGCQSYLDTATIFPGITTPVLLKRSCFLCEETLTASLEDGIKMIAGFFRKPKNKYGVIYGDGTLTKGWV